MVFSSALLPLTICSILVAAVIGMVVRFRPAWRQLVALSVLSAIVGLGAYHIGQCLHPGAGANLLRSAAYFDGNDAARHLGVLNSARRRCRYRIAWTLLGSTAIIVGHHNPVRFAAHRGTDDAESAPQAHHRPQEAEIG